MLSIFNTLWRPIGSQTESSFPCNSNHNPRSAPPLASPCTGRIPQKKFSHRISLFPGEIALFGWPSRGGVIVFEPATPPDFDFLRLDSLDPPLDRDKDQESEDTFCRGLLRLGATWWDSPGRRTFVKNLIELDKAAIFAVDSGEQLSPTRRERRWVRVAWPSKPEGSLYVLECVTNATEISERKVLVPMDAGRVDLARTMDERCLVLERLGATFYSSVEDYQGSAFLRAWEEGKHEGEVGPLLRTRPKWIVS